MARRAELVGARGCKSVDCLASRLWQALLRQRPSNPDQTDPDYTALMDELDDVGQREPGIVSPHGILVDGNTRAAALIDLGVQNIRVGVLPDDTTRKDINSVELSLQLASALERIAAEQEIAAVDLADVWFLDGPADDHPEPSVLRV